MSVPVPPFLSTSLDLHTVVPATVIKTRTGALAQYARVPADHLVPIPPGLSPVQAAGVTLAGMTAYQALFDVAGLQPEQSVFVNGGSTAVGAFAIQLAKAVGCKVAASASAKNEAYVRGLGADEVRPFLLFIPRHPSLMCVCGPVL